MLRRLFAAMFAAHTATVTAAPYDPEVAYDLDTFSGILAFYRDNNRSIGQ